MMSKHAIYSGKVQGVGFRRTVQKLSTGFRVVGYVRNLAGGDVEVWAEGDLEEVDAFLAKITEVMSTNVASCNTVEKPPLRLIDFQILYK